MTGAGGKHGRIGNANSFSPLSNLPFIPYNTYDGARHRVGIPYWRKLLTWIKSVILSCLDLEQCSLKVLEPEGSPSLCLLKLMGEKGCTVMELSDFLLAMEHTEVLQLLSPPGRFGPWVCSPGVHGDKLGGKYLIWPDELCEISLEKVNVWSLIFSPG